MVYFFEFDNNCFFFQVHKANDATIVIVFMATYSKYEKHISDVKSKSYISIAKPKNLFSLFPYAFGNIQVRSYRLQVWVMYILIIKCMTSRY